MLPHTHFLFALLIGVLAYYKGQITAVNIIVIAILSTIIDIDHPLAYFKHHKKLNLRKAWNNSITGHEYERTVIHKPTGILVIGLFLFILIKFYPFTNVIFLAYFSHIFLDYIHLTKEKVAGKHKFMKLSNILIYISPSEIIFDVILIISNIAAFYFVF